MKLKKILALFLALALLGGCSLPSIGVSTEEPEATPEISAAPVQQSETTTDDRFTLSYVADYGFNPLVTTSALNLAFTPLIYETLFTIDESYNAAPCLVTDYHSDDGIYWYFTVDTGVKFHDGSYLEAADAAYSLQRAMYSTRYGSRLSIIAGVSATSESEFVVRLNRVNRMLPVLLDIPVIPCDSIEDPAPAGTGPYRIADDWKSLQLFEGHREAKSMPIDVIYLREYVSAEDTISAFESAELDLVTNDPTGLSDLGYGSANELRYYNTTCMHYIGFNSESAFFQQPERRHLVTFAINRSEIVTNIMGGVGVASAIPVHPASSLYTNYSDSLDYSVDKMVKCLVSAEVLDHDDDGKLEYLVTGVPMEINLNFIVNSESAIKVSAARLIAEELRSYGISVTLHELSWSDYTTALAAGDFDMYYGEVMLSADWDLTSLIGSGGKLNYGKFKDSSYDSLISDYLSASDTERQSSYELLLQYIGNSSPLIPICFEKRELLTHRGVAQGLQPTFSNIFSNFQNWTITLGD